MRIRPSTALRRPQLVADAAYNRPADRKTEALLSVVTVSSKFQVVIPREIRDALGIRPGQRVQGLQYLDRIEYIPLTRAKAMRGFLRGIDTKVPREHDCG